MRTVLAPDPVDWVGQFEGKLIAPWALPRRGPGRFLGRRYLPGASGWPGWTLLEGLARLWAGSDTARGYRARFALRRLVANLVRPSVGGELLAPSLGALEPFARHEGKKVLLLDLPLLGQLNQDLDRALTSHPRSSFLRRFRASRSDVVRQEQEFVLADEILVGHPYVLELLKGRGLPCRLWERALPRVKKACPGRDILLAGLPTGRNGIYEMLEVLSRHPEWRLRVRMGEGLEPTGLLDHPQVRVARDFEEVAVVVAPSWVESSAVEVGQAELLGLPVIATDRAAGFAGCRRVRVGDAEALEKALEQIL